MCLKCILIVKLIIGFGLTCLVLFRNSFNPFSIFFESTFANIHTSKFRQVHDRFNANKQGINMEGITEREKVEDTSQQISELKE